MCMNRELGCWNPSQVYHKLGFSIIRPTRTTRRVIWTHFPKVLAGHLYIFGDAFTWSCVPFSVQFWLDQNWTFFLWFSARMLLGSGQVVLLNPSSTRPKKQFRNPHCKFHLTTGILILRQINYQQIQEFVPKLSASSATTSIPFACLRPRESPFASTDNIYQIKKEDK